MLVLHRHEALLPATLPFAVFPRIGYGTRRGWPWNIRSGLSVCLALVFHMFAEDFIVTGRSSRNSRAVSPRATSQSLDQIDAEFLDFCPLQCARWEDDSSLAEFGADGNGER